MYDAVDVTALVVPGCNALGVMVFGGWWDVVGGVIGKPHGPATRVVLSVTDESGATAYYASTLDGAGLAPGTLPLQFSSSSSPATSANVYGGASYDARLEQPGWAACAFMPPAGAASWSPASAPATDPLAPYNGTGTVPLISANPTPIRIDQDFPLAAVTEYPTGDGSWLADFGRACKTRALARAAHLRRLLPHPLTAAPPPPPPPPPLPTPRPRRKPRGLSVDPCSLPQRPADHLAAPQRDLQRRRHDHGHLRGHNHVHMRGHGRARGALANGPLLGVSLRPCDELARDALPGAVARLALRARGRGADGLLPELERAVEQDPAQPAHEQPLEFDADADGLPYAREARLRLQRGAARRERHHELRHGRLLFALDARYPRRPAAAPGAGRRHHPDGYGLRRQCGRLDRVHPRLRAGRRALLHLGRLSWRRRVHELLRGCAASAARVLPTHTRMPARARARARARTRSPKHDLAARPLPARSP
jgi:hypothetical protein